MNLFDGLQTSAQAIVENTMGYVATWSPSAGGPEQTAKVLLNNPTHTEEISDVDFEVRRPRMEYFEGAFPGLFESVRDNGTETVTINGIEYTCFSKGSGKFDGKTIVIILEPVS